MKKSLKLERIIKKSLKGFVLGTLLLINNDIYREYSIGSNDYSIKKENKIINITQELTNEFQNEIDRALDAIYYMPYKNFVLKNLFREIIFKYGLFIEDASKKYGIDKETIIALIAKESRGDMTAKSSKGAIGLMQLLKSTAKELGLRVDHYVDERMSMKSIYAGTKYLVWLKKFYHKYASNHMLGLIAYNFGVGSTDKLFYKMRTCFEPSFAWQRLKKFLPKETIEYIIDILAWRELIKEIESNETIPHMEYIVKKTNIWANKDYLFYLSRKYKVSVKEIKKFNPHIKNWNFVPPKTEIYIPRKNFKNKDKK